MQESFLYTIIDKKQLKEVMEAFQQCMDLPIQLIDDNGSILLSYGSTASFCSRFQQFLPENETCEKLHIDASKKAIDLGETYIFSCHANLNHIIFPLQNSGTFLGSVLVGPFLMDQPDSLLIQDISKRYSIPTSTLLDLYDDSSSIRILRPSIVTQISRLLYYLLANLITESRQQMIINQGKLYQQSRINESIQNYKSGTPKFDTNYPYELEKSLLAKVKIGNIQEAKGVLNDLLGYVFFSEGHSLETIKSRAIELCSLLSRATIEGGAPTDSILKINNNFLKILQKINDFESLCYKLQEIVEEFINTMFNLAPTKNHDLIKRAIRYIAKNYSSPITLEDVANHVNLNPSYFSSVFKNSTGSSFKEYLNMVRIEESKLLLANTGYSIIDIAVATGFGSQSYFSKTFKKYTGLTPKQYR